MEPRWQLGLPNDMAWAGDHPDIYVLFPRINEADRFFLDFSDDYVMYNVCHYGSYTHVLDLITNGTTPEERALAMWVDATMSVDQARKLLQKSIEGMDIDD